MAQGIYTAAFTTWCS